MPKEPKHEEGEGLAVKESDPELSDPKDFAVLLHDDNYTSMDFVVEVLTHYFKKDEPEALRLMLKIHNEGNAVAGIYSQEIAESKMAQVIREARARGFPLACTLKEI